MNGTLAAEIADVVFNGDEDAIMFDARGVNFTPSELLAFMRWIENNPSKAKTLRETIAAWQKGNS